MWLERFIYAQSNIVQWCRPLGSNLLLLARVPVLLKWDRRSHGWIQYLIVKCFTELHWRRQWQLTLSSTAESSLPSLVSACFASFFKMCRAQKNHKQCSTGASDPYNVYFVASNVPQAPLNTSGYPGRCWQNTVSSSFGSKRGPECSPQCVDALRLRCVQNLNRAVLTLKIGMWHKVHFPDLYRA